MKQRRYLLVNIVLSICVLLIMNGRLEATSYSFSVDRFEVVGNLPSYFVDEFDDGVLDPAWYVYSPTVAEFGGVMTLSSPGSSGSGLIGDLLIYAESTKVNSMRPGQLTVQDGAGDFTGISTWLPELPALSQQFNMGIFHLIGPDITEGFSISVVNMENAVANALGFPTGGLAIGFGKESFDTGIFEFQAFPIDPADVSGDILLQLAFDDAGNQFTGAFSLDGGITFQSPFTPVSPSAGEAEFIWGMQAMSLKVVPIPPSLFLLVSGLAGLAGFGRKRLFKEA